MSYQELTTNTLKRFSKTWNNTNSKSLLSEFISISKETNREPDTYHFTIENNKLTDPNTKRPVLDFIEEGVEKDVARNLEDWAIRNEEGLALWISPSLEGKYPCSKIIIHKIAYTQNKEKVILNSVILFDTEIKNPNYKRKTLYTLPDSEDNIFKILNWVKRKSKEETNFETSSKTSLQKAKYFVDQIRMGIPHQQIIEEMKKSEFLGKNSISCAIGVSFSNLVESSSSIYIFSGEDEYGTLEFPCPSCGATNRRPSGQLISNCQHCGKDVRC
jgi:hypothetical protein